MVLSVYKRARSMSLKHTKSEGYRKWLIKLHLAITISQ